MTHTVTPAKTYIITFVLLMLLLAATVGVAYMDLGELNLPVAMGISITKAALIILFFMHVRSENKFIGVVACAGFFWLAILLSFAMNDYVSRHW